MNINVELLQNKIRSISESMVVYESTGYDGYVVYLSGEKMSVGDYSDLTPYSSQYSEKGTTVSFMTQEKSMVTFLTSATTKTVDRKSFEKYKGLIYIFEPLTDEIASQILNQVETFSK